MSKVQISQLNIYPVKSLKGISLNESEVTVEGLKYDRNWMIIDSENKFESNLRTAIKHPLFIE